MTDQETFTLNLAGRDIVFRYPTAGQLIVLQRRLLKLQQLAKQATDERQQGELSSRVIVSTLDVVESLIMDEADATFLEEAMLLGKVGHEEVMDVLRTKREDQKPAKAARKPAAKAAKAVANRGRTKR